MIIKNKKTGRFIKNLKDKTCLFLAWSKFPDLRYQLNNGITLCYFHHPRKTADVEQLSPYFQELVASLE